MTLSRTGRPRAPAAAAAPTSAGRVRALALLAAAVGSECTGTLMLQVSRGFTAPVGALGVLAGYLGAILLFSRALGHGLTLGIAYAAMTGCGLVAATVLSALVLGEAVATAQVGGLALILLGALVLQLDGRSSP